MSLRTNSESPVCVARQVPERMDDFVFENNLVCGRIYGQALEGNPTSPGIDIWVKLPGALVADDWYRHYSEEGSEDYYHHDHGGKDCYKVAVSLGGGASAPILGGRLVLPPTNYRSWEIIKESPEEVIFRLDYPEWEVDGERFALSKTITVVPDTYFFKAEDVFKQVSVLSGGEKVRCMISGGRHKQARCTGDHRGRAVRDRPLCPVGACLGHIT